MSAATLLGAIVALWDADVTLATDFIATGGLWPCKVPDDKSVLPLAILVHHDEVPTWTFGTTREDDGLFDFVIYSKGLLQDAEALAQHVMDVFDPKSNATRGLTPPRALVRLDIANVNTRYVRRLGYRVIEVDYRTADSDRAYEITMPYRSYVEKQI